MRLVFVHFEDAFAEWQPSKFRTTHTDSQFLPEYLESWCLLGQLGVVWDVCSVAPFFRKNVPESFRIWSLESEQLP